MSTFTPRIRNRTSFAWESRSLSFALQVSAKDPGFLVLQVSRGQPWSFCFSVRILGLNHKSQLNENQGSMIQGLVAGRETLCVGEGPPVAVVGQCR